jgi:hypothetical protein
MPLRRFEKRLATCHAIGYPTAAWTRRQLREALGVDRRYYYLIHDRDSIFSAELDASVGSFGLRVQKAPPRCPMANAICERVIGTISSRVSGLTHSGGLIPSSFAPEPNRCDRGLCIAGRVRPITDGLAASNAIRRQYSGDVRRRKVREHEKAPHS